MTLAATDDLKARQVQLLAEHPLGELIHPTLEKLDLDYCEIRMPFRHEITNGYGAVHGGLLTTLADTAMAFALSTNFDGRMPFATSELTIHFFKRAETDVIARARVVKKGKRINVGLIDLVDPDGELLATVLTSFVLTA